MYLIKFLQGVYPKYLRKPWDIVSPVKISSRLTMRFFITFCCPFLNLSSRVFDKPIIKKNIYNMAMKLEIIFNETLLSMAEKY